MSLKYYQGSNDGPIFPPPLTEAQAEQLKKIHGLNVIETGRKLTWYNVLLSALFHPFNILLIILAAASGSTGDVDALCIMMVIVFLSTVIRFWQEWRSAIAAKSLRKMVTNQVCVIRLNDLNRSQRFEKEIPLEDIVPGDWVKLSAGDLIPADIQIIESKDLFVSQSSLTGEAIPVEKYVSNHQMNNMNNMNTKSAFSTQLIKNDVYIIVEKTNQIKNGNNNHNARRRTSTISSELNRIFRNIFGLQVYSIENEISMNKADLDSPDLCYMGTSIVSGTAKAIVLQTGHNTYFGSMAEELMKLKPQNAFQMGVRRISWMFFIVMACMVPPVLLIQGFFHQDWSEAFLFALSVAVGLTPEMLPMIVSSTLARGALLMSRKKCIVKNLDSIINLGGMDVLCTDKTGTLTENQVALIRHVDFFGKTSALPLQLAFLNSFFQTSLKNLLDLAVIDYHEKAINSKQKLNNQTISSTITSYFTKIDEIPFDFERRRMSVILSSEENYILISKGAVEEMLKICSHIKLGKNGGTSLPIMTNEIIQMTIDDTSKCNLNDLDLSSLEDVQVLNQDMVDHLKTIDQMFNKEGIRVVAVAYKTFTEVPLEFERKDEVNMVFAGFIGFLDPPKESAKPAIRYLMEHNISVKVLTGDSAEVCRKVCQEINLPVSTVVTTNDLIGISEEEFENISEKATIFAKLTPLQKAQVIRALKRKNHIIGFLGDGINDSPALAEADIGISVDTGADIAKESADIILLEKDLRVVTDGVRYGRRTYGNTLKYIVMAVSSNFGNVFSVLVASCWLPFLPMKPIHLLTQNLLYDISQIAIPWDNMDPEYLLVPHRWSMKSVLLFMVFMGPWSSVFDITTYLWMYYYYGIQSPADNVALFQTTWFTEGLLTQTLIVHMIRTPKIPFFQSRASPFVMAMTILIVGIGLAVPYIPGIKIWLDLVEIEPLIYPYVFGEILAYCLIAQFAKVLYIRIFKEWY